jgi:hypothetical protein
MDKNIEVKVVILERTIEQLTQKFIILEERIAFLEREIYRYSRTPSFLIGDSFTFPPERG